MFEKNSKIANFKRQSIRDRAEIELKDKRIAEEVAQIDKLKSIFAEVEAKNRDLKEKLDKQIEESSAISS